MPTLRSSVRSPFTLLFVAWLSAVALLAAPWAASAQDAPKQGAAQAQPAAGATNADGLPVLTEEGVITGTMNITFNTRTNLDTTGKLVAGSSSLGAQDIYGLRMNVAKTTEFTGEIRRQPNLYTKVLRRPRQAAQLSYDLNIAVLNPRDLKQRKVVGDMVGVVPIDQASGAFNLGAGDKPLRIAVNAVGTARAFSDTFGGRLIGKAEQKDKLASYTYKRLVGKKTVEIKVTRIDPMRFENIILAKGPAEIYPRTTVNGSLDYDYETGNWITEGIRFNYTVDGKEHEDIVTGSIKWVEAEDRASSGKGQYEFNLRFNEEKNRPAETEGDAFAEMSDEDAFFAVDETIPTLTGTISYVDTFIQGGTTPSASEVTYNLNANKLTKQQIVNFFKLWLLCTGPANDE